MSQYAGGLLATAIIALTCGIGEARANDLVNEVRLGILDHDTGVVGSSKEDGVDFGVEFLSPPVAALDFLNAPRLVAGALVNSAGQTNQVYVGLLAQWSFAADVIRPGDEFFLEGTVAGAWHDGKLDVIGTPEEADWKSHGSNLVFRTGFGIGYRINETWSLAFNFSHISNADIVEPNEGSNDIGLRLGWKL